jgi:H/ACA ribonucleoprotein complex subunit 2
MGKDTVKEEDATTSSDKKASSSSSKKSSTATSSSKEVSYEQRCLAVNAISHPLAGKKSTKKVHKLVRKAAGKKLVRRGVKETIKGIRKNEIGLVILAGDIYPIDVISHVPILLEEKNIPYLFVPSKFDLGTAASTKRATSCILIKPPPAPSSSTTTTSSGKKKKKSKKDKDDDTKMDDGDEDVTTKKNDNEDEDYKEMKELYDSLMQEAQDYDPTTIIKSR